MDRTDILNKKSDIRSWIEENKSKAYISRRLQCKPETLNKYLNLMQIEYDGNSGGKGTKKPKKNLMEYIQGTCVKSYVVRKKLVEEGYREHRCEGCGLSEWLDKPIPLELHHIDGNNSNYSLENLRLLCPNCHALTDNYRGKAKQNQKQKPFIDEQTFVDALSSSDNIHEALLKLNLKGQGGNYIRAQALIQKYNIIFNSESKQDFCIDCGAPITQESIRCVECYNKQQSKCCISRDELKQLIRNKPFTSIATMYDVSDNAIRKWCTRYQLPKNKNKIKKFTDEEWERI